MLVLLLAVGCNGERAALLRGQEYYEDNQYERALSLWRRSSDASASSARAILRATRICAA